MKSFWGRGPTVPEKLRNTDLNDTNPKVNIAFKWPQCCFIFYCTKCDRNNSFTSFEDVFIHKILYLYPTLCSANVVASTLKVLTAEISRLLTV
jgi:hypothetical protein